jgi:hypothetical protein
MTAMPGRFFQGTALGLAERPRGSKEAIMSGNHFVFGLVRSCFLTRLLLFASGLLGSLPLALADASGTIVLSQ